MNSTLRNTLTQATSTSVSNDWLNIQGTADYTSQYVQFTVSQDKGISPQLYFKYVKNKLGVLEKLRLESRIKKIEKAFYAALENGQEALGSKILHSLARETRESVIYAKGVRNFIDKEDLNKHKRNIRGGHISDTPFKDFTRIIPKAVLDKKKKVEDCFDDFVIYHYWNPNAKDVKKMSSDEKARMKDPILFGIIKESERLYFIADWEDEQCDLNFEEMIDVIGKDDEEFTLKKEPQLI